MWATAILLGLAGSLHCLGMCSPLAMAVTSLSKPFIINRLVYNLGRILTYGLLGMFVSTFGALFQFSEFQNTLSIVLGIILIVFGITGISHVRIPLLTASLQKLTTKIKNLFALFLKKKTIGAVVFMGMLNGLLPCGLTYLALTYCITLPTAFNGFLFMLIFGAGTLPVMLGLTSFLHSLISRFNLGIGRFTTYMMIALGVLLVARSMFIHHPVSSPGADKGIVICR